MGFLGSFVSLTSDAAGTVAEKAEETGRIFGLDYQILFDAAIVAVNVFIVFIILSYVLFNPARNMLKKRADRITSERETTQADMEAAQALKTEYEDKVKNVAKEAEDILSDARKKALQREAQIVAQAKEEAARIIQHANVEVNLEKKRVIDEVKQEIINVASIMAGKMVSKTIDAQIGDVLLEETLNEMSGDTWLS